MTGIQLNDNFTNVITGIINSVSIAVSSISEMQGVMSADVDMSSLNAAREELARATVAADQFTQSISDNVSGQNNFQNSLQASAQHTDMLSNKIGRIVASIATAATLKEVFGISDELTQTTSRLNMMNDGLQSTADLMDMVYASAQDARGSYTDMASVVARFGNNAKEAFSSSAEVVQFANLVQKQMNIAGASTQESANAMLQLSQALGSGVLRGDELNSIFEQSPNLIRNIADYIQNNEEIAKHMAGVLDVSYENMSTNAMKYIRDLAQEGQLSADLVKNAIFDASDEINAKFEEMPATWGQLWTMFKNDALKEFQPVLQQLNDLANSAEFQDFTNNALSGLSLLASVAVNAFELIGQAGSFVADNWSVIAPILGVVVGLVIAYNVAMGIHNAVTAISAAAAGVHAAAVAMQSGATFAATAAQYGFNAALLACPLTWIVIAIIAVIAVVIAFANHIAKTGDTATTAFGVITGGIFVVGAFFKNLGLEIANIAIGIGLAIAALGTNIKAAFHNAISSVQSWWYALLSTALGVIENICAALNRLPFVDFDYSGIASAADSYAAKSASAAANKYEYTSIGAAFDKGMNTFDAYNAGWVQDAYQSGAARGDNISNNISSKISALTEKNDASDYQNQLADANNNLDLIGKNTDNTAKNSASAAKALSASAEDLKYIRTMAEQKYINRFTTAEIKVDMTNHNNINNTTDLDGIASHLKTKLEEEMAAAAEGVHT